MSPLWLFLIVPVSAAAGFLAAAILAAGEKEN